MWRSRFLAITGGRGGHHRTFTTAESQVPAKHEHEDATWFRVGKLLATRVVYRFLAKRCEKSEICARRMTTFMKVSQEKKSSLVAFALGQPKTTVELPYDVNGACETFSKVYTSSMLTFGVFSGGLLCQLIWDQFKAAKRALIDEARDALVREAVTQLSELRVEMEERNVALSNLETKLAEKDDLDQKAKKWWWSK